VETPPPHLVQGQDPATADAAVVKAAVAAGDVDAVPLAVVEAWTEEAPMPGVVEDGGLS